MMRRRFTTLDVFTNRRFAGNPLAVVIDAEGLDGKRMQAIAREFNLAATVFVLPPERPDHRARLRIFTPAVELPFAGHPTVGTAVLLNRIGGGGAREFLLEEPIGLIPCATASIDADCGTARFRLARLPEEDGEPRDVEIIAVALSLDPGDIGCGDFTPSCWSAGVPLTFVPVRGLETISRCEPDLTHWAEAFGADGHAAVYVFCQETIESRSAFHARMFAPRLGVMEDPATGAAAAAFSGLLARFAPPVDGDREFTIEQGCEMGRPSFIRLGVTMKHRQLVSCASINGRFSAV